jgi:hypothetical protein
MEDIYKEKYLKYKTKYNAFKRKVARKLKELSKLKMPKGDPKMVKSLETLRANNLAGNLERSRPLIASPQPFRSVQSRPFIASPQPLYPVSLIRPSVFIGFPRFVTAPSSSPSSSFFAPALPKPIYPTKKNQIVYGVFNKDTGEKLNLIKSKVTIPEEYVDKTFIKTIHEAHTSIVYEPEYNIEKESDEEKVIASIPKYELPTDLNKMYPNFSEFLTGFDKIDDLVLVGANAFFRENRVIIKVTFNSEKMNAIRNFLYSIPSMKQYKEAWIERLNRIAPVLESKYGTSEYFKKDKTFAEPPEGGYIIQ